MRILQFTPRYWPVYGGSETYLHEFSRRLARDGHDVFIATSNAGAAECFWNPHARRLDERQANYQGVNIRRFPLRHLPGAPRTYSLWRYIVFFGLSHLLPVAWINRLARYTPWVPNLWDWLETTRERFDLLAAINVLYEPFLLAALQAARRWSMPLVVYPLTHLGAGARPAADRVSRYYTMRHQVAAVLQADCAITITPTEADFYASRGMPREHLRVVAGGINPDELAGGNAEYFRAKHQLLTPIVTFLSAMAYDKGATHVVDAVRQLWQAGHNFELVMAGTLWPDFQRHLSRLPVTDRARIRILGHISDEEKRDLLAATDVLAMPSRTDSFGIVYLEAWFYGKPVIGARAWGIADVITHGVDGVLVPFGDVETLAYELASLLAAPARRVQFGEAGRRKVLQHYTWEQQYAIVRATYEHLTA
jgi:glycogen synthase